MNGKIIFRDKRLRGEFKYLDVIVSDGFFEFGETTPLVLGLRYLFEKARNSSGKIKSLYVMCHGYGSYIEQELLTYKIPVWVGGEGLQLGKDGLHLGNVNLWSTVKDTVEEIVIYACGAAAVQNEGVCGSGNGRELMSSLAKTTNAKVFAADIKQWYFVSGMDFSSWEGQLYLFKPDGAIKRVPFNWRYFAN